jgi:hypothetical protein
LLWGPILSEGDVSHETLHLQKVLLKFEAEVTSVVKTFLDGGFVLLNSSVPHVRAEMES